MDWKLFLVSEHQLSVSLEDQLHELAADGSMKIVFKSAESLVCFYMKARTEYPELAEIAIKILLQFPSTKLCETAFSTMSIIKNKYGNHFDIQAPMRVALSSIKPRLNKLTSKKINPLFTLITI